MTLTCRIYSLWWWWFRNRQFRVQRSRTNTWCPNVGFKFLSLSPSLFFEVHGFVIFDTRDKGTQKKPSNYIHQKFEKPHVENRTKWKQSMCACSVCDHVAFKVFSVKIHTHTHTNLYEKTLSVIVSRISRNSEIATVWISVKKGTATYTRTTTSWCFSWSFVFFYIHFVFFSVFICLSFRSAVSGWFFYFGWLLMCYFCERFSVVFFSSLRSFNGYISVLLRRVYIVIQLYVFFFSFVRHGRFIFWLYCKEERREKKNRCKHTYTRNTFSVSHGSVLTIQPNCVCFVFFFYFFSLSKFTSLLRFGGTFSVLRWHHSIEVVYVAQFSLCRCKHDEILFFFVLFL